MNAFNSFGIGPNTAGLRMSKDLLNSKKNRKKSKNLANTKIEEVEDDPLAALGYKEYLVSN